MRYIYASYNAKKRGGSIFGNVGMACKKFPSHREMVEFINEGEDPQETVIISIFEFKSKKDYDLFLKK